MSGDAELKWRFKTRPSIALKAIDVESGAEVRAEAFRKNQKIKLQADSASDSVAWNAMCVEFGDSSLDSVFAIVKDLGDHCFIEAQDTQFQNQVIRILFNKDTTPAK